MCPTRHVNSWRGVARERRDRASVCGRGASRCDRGGRVARRRRGGLRRCRGRTVLPLLLARLRLRHRDPVRVPDVADGPQPHRRPVGHAPQASLRRRRHHAAALGGVVSALARRAADPLPVDTSRSGERSRPRAQGELPRLDVVHRACGGGVRGVDRGGFPAPPPGEAAGDSTRLPDEPNASSLDRESSCAPSRCHSPRWTG